MKDLSPLAWFAILAVVVVLIYWLTTRRRSPSRNLDRLVLACLGDRAKAERLIEYEVRKAPGISRDEAKARAFDRLERDRIR